MSKSLAKDMEDDLGGLDRLLPIKPKQVMPGAFKPTTRLQKRGARRGFRSFNEAKMADMCMQMRFSREWAAAKAKQARKEEQDGTTT
jgi:hypothetical protein